MEIFLNTKYQGLKDLVNIPTIQYSVLPLFGSDLQNRLAQGVVRAEKKIGFVPFKIPYEKDTEGQISIPDDEESGESAESLLMSSQEISESGGKTAKNKKGPYRKYTL